MALTSPALTLANEVLFANCKPVLDALRRLGPTDFSEGKPEIQAAPGATIKVPVSSVSAALAYNESTNNYLTGGDTVWASLTASHYLQGFDITGVNVDQGVNAGRMKQLFALRASTGIAMAIQAAIKGAFNALTESTIVTLAGTATATIEDYMKLGDDIVNLDKSTSVLVVNGTEWASIKAKFAAKSIVAAGSADYAQFIGFKDIVVVPGMTPRAVIVPANSFGCMARVPAIIAGYPEFGTEVDPDTGLAVGIVVASNQATNKQVVNADMWFGCCTQAATEADGAFTGAGMIRVKTAV